MRDSTALSALDSVDLAMHPEQISIFCFKKIVPFS
ncbi:Hypothetical protein Bdt_2861 [Bdellovibrio bacteriovorus str. Tiberius]|uniref:Uncharacterized protein n=1 Tax=Bdellovibrio bacteriovorus str. Tiberius TaxID=1069642 RepID=K7YRP5_BDEBC|nr:Hypothetical protein Bdt_2861 [Bdellovibrio bacteriovorus str. Tiberius]